MKLRTLLAASAVGTLLVGAAGAPSLADPDALPDARSGQVVAWGTGTPPEVLVVPPELTDEQVVSVSASENGSAAVTADGDLLVWGKPDVPEVDAAPTGLTDVSSVALDFKGGVALKEDGSVVGWGDNGLDAAPAGLVATAVTASGGGKAYAVTSEGTLASWGTGAAPDPAPPAGLSGLVDVSAAPMLGLALDQGGNVHAWGAVSGFAEMPAGIQGHVTQITTGGYAAGVILDDGTVRTWGVGAPAVPGALTGKTVVELAIYGSNAVATTDEGETFAWGSTPAMSAVPAAVSDGHAAAVAMSKDHALVIVTNFRAVTSPAVAGTAKVGQTLTATPAELSLEPDSPATGQWLADGDPIAGADSTTLELDEDLIGSMISYQTTATRGADDVESTSNEIGPVTPLTVASTTALSVAPASGGYGAARTATATVAAPDGTPTGSVTFTLDGKTATATLTGGKATWKLPNDLTVGTHSLSANYAGDSATDPSASTATTVTVAKAGSMLTVGKTKVKGKGKVMAKKATLNLDVDTDTGTSAAGTVTLKLKAKGSKTKKVTVTVGADGDVKIKLKKLKRGAYKATWTYAGSATVDGSTAKAKVKI